MGIPQALLRVSFARGSLLTSTKHVLHHFLSLEHIILNTMVIFKSDIAFRFPNPLSGCILLRKDQLYPGLVVRAV